MRYTLEDYNAFTVESGYGAEVWTSRMQNTTEAHAIRLNSMVDEVRTAFGGSQVQVGSLKVNQQTPWYIETSD